MYLAVRCAPVESHIAVRSVDNRIRAFLAGDSDGEDLLHDLYDHVMDEPVPERLRGLLKR